MTDGLSPKKNKVKKISSKKNESFSFKSKNIKSPAKKPIKNKNVSTMQDDLANLVTKKKGFKPIESQDDEEIQRELVEVYTNGDGQIPDLTRLDKEQRPLWKTILYVLSAVLFLLLIVAIAGFFVFSNINNNNNFTNERITLKIEPPLTMISGQEATYTVMITNKEKVNLYNAQLTITYPENFQYLEAEPQASGEKNNTWDFSVLKVGETKKIELKGKMIAAIDSVQTFKGTLEFKPANLNATFKQEAIIDVAVSSSIINLDIEGPERTLGNQEVEYIIEYKNISEDDLSDIQLVAEYPEGFIFNSSEPEAEEENNNLWTIEELLADGEGIVKIKGDYSAVSEGGNKEFKIRIQLKQDNDYYPQQEETFITDVIKDQLSLQLIINGSAEDQPTGFEDLLVYSVNFKNTGQEDLEDIEITAHLDSPILDWSTLIDPNNGQVSSGSIIWTGREVSKLLKLGPDEEGELSFQIRVEDADYARTNEISKFSVESYIEATAKQTGETTGESTVKSKTIVSSVSSDLGLTAQARYYSEDNVPLGLGPIRPRVGEISTYNIKLNLANNLNDVKDVRIIASLPKSSVSWANKETHSTGDLVYDSGSNKVTWAISRLPKSADNTEASFNVSITPTDDDFGRVLILVSELTLNATDADTGANIEKNLTAITTSFYDPILGQVSGIVE